MVLISHMMVYIITLFGIINFYLLFKFNIYKKSGSINITYDGTYIIFDDTYIIFDDIN